MKKVLDWFVKSSADPSKLSLTLKSLVVFAVMFGVDSSVADEGAGHLVNLIVAIGMLVSASTGAYGFGRKIYATYKK